MNDLGVNLYADSLSSDNSLSHLGEREPAFVITVLPVPGIVLSALHALSLMLTAIL